MLSWRSGMDFANEIQTPLLKRSTYLNGLKRQRLQFLPPFKNLTFMTAFDSLIHISKKCRLIISHSQNFVGCCFPKKVTLAISLMKILHNLLFFFFNQTIQQNTTRIFPIEWIIQNTKLSSLQLQSSTFVPSYAGRWWQILNTTEKAQRCLIPELMNFPHSPRT